VTIPVGVIEQFLHPPVGDLFNHVDSFSPYAAGDHTIVNWGNGGVASPISNTFGILLLQHGVIPPFWGVTFGAALGGATPFTGDEYLPRIAQVVVQHQLIFGLGGWVTTQIVDIFHLATMILWQEALPGRIGLQISPGWAFDMQVLAGP